MHPSPQENLSAEVSHRGFGNLQVQFGRDACILDGISKPPKLKNLLSGAQGSRCHLINQLKCYSSQRTGFLVRENTQNWSFPWDHSVQIPIQCFVLLATILQSQHSIWNSVKSGGVFSIFFFFLALCPTSKAWDLNDDYLIYKIYYFLMPHFCSCQ